MSPSPPVPEPEAALPSLFDRLRLRIKPIELRRRCMSTWLLEDLNLAYIAIPKAASSGIRNLIRDRQARKLLDEAAGEDSRARRRIEKRIKHSTTPARLGPLRQRYFFFSFVRNPISRLYSCYRDKILNAQGRRPRCSLSPYGIHFGMSFDQFIARVAAIPDNQSDQHFRSQHTFIAHEGQLVVDYLGRFEQFSQDWTTIEQRFGLPEPGRDHRVSGPPVSLSALPISRASVELAAQRYQRDIELFGYQQQIDQLLDALTDRAQQGGVS